MTDLSDSQDGRNRTRPPRTQTVMAAMCTPPTKTCVTSTPDVLGTPTYRTTYKECYRPQGVGDGGLPPVYHQQPAIELLLSEGGDRGQLAPRAFPLIPPGPKRRPRARPSLGPGLGTGHLNTERYVPITSLFSIRPKAVLWQVHVNLHGNIQCYAQYFVRSFKV